MSRYARQISVKSVGQQGHSKVRNGAVEICGHGLDAQICALYLAGAGVGTITCDARLAEQVRAINSDVTIREKTSPTTDFVAVCGSDSFRSDKSNELGRGSQVARDVIACFLRG